MNLRNKISLLLMLLLLISGHNKLHSQTLAMRNHLEKAEQYIRNGDCENAKKEYDKYVNLNRGKVITYYKERAKQVSWSIDQCLEKKQETKPQVTPVKPNTQPKAVQHQTSPDNYNPTEEPHPSTPKAPTTQTTSPKNNVTGSTNLHIGNNHADSKYKAENQRIENFNKFKSTGESLFQQKQFLAAKEAYQNAMEYASCSSDEDLISEQINRCDCSYWMMKGDSLYNQKNYEEANDYYNKALNVKNSDFTIEYINKKIKDCNYYYYLQQGDSYFKKEKYSEAKKYFQNALTFNERNSDIINAKIKECEYKDYLFSGENCFRQYKFSEALSFYTKAAKYSTQTDSLLLSRIKFCKDRTSCTVTEIRDNESGTGNRINSLRDHEGNEYGVVQIGKQCWMSQNLRTKTIPNFGGICNYKKTPISISSKLDSIAGLLYKDPSPRTTKPSLNSSDDLQGMCPQGWHIPSHNEWVEFIDYVFVKKTYGFYYDKIKFNPSQWAAKSIVHTESWDDSSIPYGNEPLLNNASGFSAIKTNAYGCYFNFFGIRPYSMYYSNEDHFFKQLSINDNFWYAYIRCIRDSALYIMKDCGKVRDNDGNTYNTVQIGEQCWMAENLRTNSYSDGKKISKDPDFSEKTGRTYAWAQVMGKEQPSNNNPSGVQGICPTGWHIPSETEWKQLRTYVYDNISSSPLAFLARTNYVDDPEKNKTGFNGYKGQYWSCSEDPSRTTRFIMSLADRSEYRSGYMSINDFHKRDVKSCYVRCVHDK